LVYKSVKGLPLPQKPKNKEIIAAKKPKPFSLEKKAPINGKK